MEFQPQAFRGRRSRTLGASDVSDDCPIWRPKAAATWPRDTIPAALSDDGPSSWPELQCPGYLQRLPPVAGRGTGLLSKWPDGVSSSVVPSRLALSAALSVALSYVERGRVQRRRHVLEMVIASYVLKLIISNVLY